MGGRRRTRNFWVMRGPRDSMGTPEGRRPRMTQKFRAPRPNAAPPERARRARFSGSVQPRERRFFWVIRVLSSSICTDEGLQGLGSLTRVAVRGRDHAHRAPQPVTKPPSGPQRPPNSRPRRPLESTRPTPEPLWAAVRFYSDTGAPLGWRGAAQAGPRGGGTPKPAKI